MYNYTVTQDDIDTIGNLEWRTNYNPELYDMSTF
jgi:hypothetical protein